MAKKKTQTPEEALVPESEQPYAVPENWVWTRLGEFCSIDSGKKNSGTVLPYLDVKALRGNTEFTMKQEGVLVPQGVKVILVDGENSGEVFETNRDGYLGSTLRILNIASSMGIEFAELFISQHKEQLKNNKKGSAIPHLNKDILYSLMLPLPPLAEQRRIVARIESLLEKLDHARELVQAALDSFETRKAAILHKAFTGELTAQWRAEHGVGMDTWERTTSNKVFEYVTSGSRGWAKYYSDSGAAFIRMGNLDHGTVDLDLSSIQYVLLPKQAEGQRTRLQKNDILISITADVGMVGVFREDFEAYINQHIALARPKTEVNAKWVAWFLVSDLGLRQLQRKQRGATKIGLGLDDIRSLDVSLPSLPEQTEIVRILDSLLDKEQKAKERLEPVLDQIDLMKKSILARAFRGELGTNDPGEESAVELLREILTR